MTKRVLFQVKAAEMELCENSMCHTSRRNAQLRNSWSLECRATSPNWKIPANLLRPYVQKSPTNIEEARALLAAPNRKRPRRRPKPRWGDYTSELAWSRLGVEPSELSEIVVDRDVFPVLLVLLPLQSFPEVKQASKWTNELIFSSFASL